MRGIPPSHARAARASLTIVGLVLLVGGCGDAADESADAADPATTPAATTAAPAATAELDSIAVLGHSGATGTMSDPQDIARDARENSWATGTNPDVRSVYLRLLDGHPALEGHAYNVAVNGTGVDDLSRQLDDLLHQAAVLPDVLLVQTIDNDIRCDGSDAGNYAPFGRALDRALTEMDVAIPDVRIFLVSQWATVEAWTTWAAHHEPQVLANSGDGPCDVFTAAGEPRPAGIRSLQRIVDAYWAEVVEVCARHPGCATDGGAEQARFVPEDGDLAADLNHLSVAGHAKYAAIAWSALPDEIKLRP